MRIIIIITILILFSCKDEKRVTTEIINVSSAPKQINSQRISKTFRTIKEIKFLDNEKMIIYKYGKLQEDNDTIRIKENGELNFRDFLVIKFGEEMIVDSRIIRKYFVYKKNDLNVSAILAFDENYNLILCNFGASEFVMKYEPSKYSKVLDTLLSKENRAKDDELCGFLYRSIFRMESGIFKPDKYDAYITKEKK